MVLPHDVLGSCSLMMCCGYVPFALEFKFPCFIPTCMSAHVHTSLQHLAIQICSFLVLTFWPQLPPLEILEGT